MSKITLPAKIRKELGKKVKKIREENKIPAIVYGHKIKSVPLTLDYLNFDKVFKKAGESEIISLKIDKKERPVLIKDIQVDPITSKYIHVDFYQIKRGEKIKAFVPLEFLGESRAVKELGGILEKPKKEIEVECLPDKLPSKIEVDISKLKTFEDLIHVKDLPIPPHIKLLEDKKEAVALVLPPRKEEEIKALEEEVEEKVEEVEGVKKEEIAEEIEEARGKEGMPPKTREKPPHEKPRTEKK